MLRRDNLQEIYPLSPMQEGMLFHAVEDPASTAYFEQLSFRMADAPDVPTFRRLWELLYRRHDILRTVFVYEAGTRPLQAVLKQAPPSIRCEDLRRLSPAEQQRYLAEWKEADRLAGFDLAAAPPSRIARFELGGGACEVVFSHHHILLDGWCLGILQQEFMAALQSVTGGGGLDDLPPPAPFSRYIAWLGKQDASAARRYWRDRLADYEELASPVRDRAGATQRPVSHYVALDAATGERLRGLSVRAGVTVATLAHAVWGLLLGRLLDRDDVVFGSVIANRPEAILGIEQMLGLFINAVPVRVTWGAGDSLLDLLGRLQAEMIARRSHEFLPLAEIQAEAGRTLFDHVMLVQNYPIEQQIGDGGDISDVELFEHTHYPLSVSVVLGAAPCFKLEYDPVRLSSADVVRLDEQLRWLVELLLGAPEQALETLPLVSGGGAAAVDAPVATTPVAQFAVAVARYAEREAVRCGDRTLTYAELDRLAGGVARKLRSAVTLRPDDRVALLARRSELLPAAILGVARAGGVYVPIDPGYPAERIAMLCRDSGARVVLAVPGSDGALPEDSLDAVPAGLPVLMMEPEWEADDGGEPPRPADLLYVAYTSGSTGRPKGVMVEHRNVAAFTSTLDNVFGLGPGDRILALTTITFDISVLELLCSLAHGMTVVVATEEQAADPELVLAAIERERISVLQVTPSRLRTLLDAGGPAVLAGLKVLLVGGEKLPAAMAEELVALGGPAVFNVYGPTEATIWSTTQRLGAAPLSIGRALPGETVAILSRNGRLCPAGVVGEICIGGVGLARGYLDQPDLTAARRVVHPGSPDMVLYRTGDLGRWRDDGEIEILGRADDQVKLRGYRIEPSEVEAALAACDGVGQVLVRAEGDSELVAYAVAESGTSVAVLREALVRRLPAWMVPNRIVLLDAMPLLPSGKIDRKRLPGPEAVVAKVAEPPRDALEGRLAALFGEVLGGGVVPSVGDDFFALGGHSLKALQLIAKLRKEFSRDLRLRDLFDAPSVAGLAGRLRAAVPAAAHAIALVEDAPSYPLSHAQRRMWVLERMLPGSPAYLLPAAFRIEGALDGAALSAAIDALVARHEALRTVFPSIDGEPRQVVLSAGPVAIERRDVSADGLDAAIRDFFGQGFALEAEPPFRVALLQHGEAAHTLLFGLHHIIADGQTLAILQRDLNRLYALPPNRPAPPGPRYRYRDVAVWQNALLDGDAVAADRAHWHRLLALPLPPLELIPDYPRPAVADPRGETLVVSFDLAESNTLRRLARDGGATLFMTAAALVAVQLRGQGAPEVRLGFPVAGRTHPDLQDVAGVFINTLVLRLAIDGAADFAAALAGTRAAVQGALEHQHYPFDRLVDELQVSRDPGRSPIFDVMVTFEPAAAGALRLGAASVSPLALPATASRFDLTFAFAETSDSRISLALEYRTSLFAPARIAGFAAQLRTLLGGLRATPDCPVERLLLLDGAATAALAAANQTAVVWPAGETLVDLVLAQVDRTPDAIAVVDEAGSLSYRALLDAGSALAHRLVGFGGDGVRVALLAERTVEAVVGVIGILLAGGAWVPLDPAQSDQRLGELLTASGCVAVVTAGSGLTERAGGLTELPVLEADRDAVGGGLAAAPVRPESPAYVIYTSGTTGVPKGVVVPHRAAVNLAHWLDRDLYDHLGRGLRQAAMASLVFDVSVHEIFGSLPRGDTLYLVPEAVKRDPRRLDAFLFRHGIEVLSITPSLLAVGLEAGLWADRFTLRHLTIGAEALTGALVDRLLSAPHRRSAALCNLYGPTECCVECICHRIIPGVAEAAVPIGRPIANTRVHLLDERLRPVPFGVAGEICLAGSGLADGYLGQSELTAERFVTLPGQPEERVYRTGDLAWRRVDGAIQFLGRRDNQVKIRGYRIELAEVEHHVLRQPGVRAAVVLPVEDALACWFVAEGEADVGSLRTALAVALPPYMVPSHLIPVAALPVTVSGKIDRAALPAPAPSGEVTAEPPVGPVEQALAAIWGDVLGCGAVGRSDDFFALGGHSLKAVRVVTAVRDRLGVDLPLSALFAAPTIAQQALLLATPEPVEADGVVPHAPEQDDYPLTAAQLRLWLLAQGDGNAAYGLAAGFRLDGALDLPALEAALESLVQRHESLRTVFPVVDGEPRQCVLPVRPWRVVVAPLSAGEDVATACQEAAAAPFDLAVGPLLRVRLWKVADDRHVLLVALHHIIGDAASLDVLMRELVTLYRDGELALPPLTRQARDFAVWEERRADDPRQAVSRDYWLTKLGGERPVLELPTDYPRPALRGWQGRTLDARLPAAVAEGLEALARGEGVSLYVMLLALSKLLLRRWSGQDDILLGTVVTGRDSAALDGQIGFYVDTLALRDIVRSDEPFVDLVRRVRDTLDQAVAHRRCGFDSIVRALGAGGDLSRNPLFDVMLVLETAVEAAPSVPGLRISPLPLESGISKLDLTFHFRRDAEGLGVAIEYRTDLFAEARIRRMLGHVRALAESVTRDRASPVGQLEMLPAEERALLARFADGGVLPVPDGRIQDLFAAQVAAVPDRAAVVSPSGVLSYRQLDRMAKRVAALLIGAGRLRSGEAVLVMLDRTESWLAALLGTLKAGGVYMPADRQHPPGRVTSMLRRSHCRLALAEMAPPGMTKLAEQDGLSLFVSAEQPDDVGASLPDDTAYLIFTSGSTGEPKGVVLGHRGFVNMITRQIETFGVGPEDRVVAFASPAFDASLSEVFMALLCGAAVVPADAGTVADARVFPDYLHRYGVTVATLPPAYLSALGRPDLGTLRVLITAGEAPVAADLRHYASRLRYFNAYGPTETSVCATIWEVPADGPADDDLPVGRPLTNTSIHVLDADLQPVPVGVAGEICVAGMGLAFGYLGNPDLTGLSFVDGLGTRLYRTGDRGVWRPDGLLSYGGRIDRQVKIRGQRVEPAGVERALEALPSVAQALVLACGQDATDRHLVAWLVRRDGIEPPSSEAIRGRLAETLPSAQVPAHIVWLDAFPRTVNGKIDQAALPMPAVADAVDHAPPRTDDEALLAEVFAQVLGVERVGIHQNFFELGGDSIRLLQVTAELGRRQRRIAIAEVYRHPTVAGLAAEMQAGEIGAEQGLIVGPAPLTAAQAWFFRTYRGNRNHFNQSVLLRVRGRLDVDGLETAMRVVVRHHDALRISIAARDGGWRQHFGDVPGGPIASLIDLRDTADADAEMSRHAEVVQRGLDLAAGRVVAAVLCRLPRQDAVLLVIHHLAVDAVSWRIVLDDLAVALDAGRQGRVLQLPPKTHAFRDWAEHQARAALSPALAAERAGWAAVCRIADDLPSGIVRDRVSHTRRIVESSLMAGQRNLEPVLLAAFARALRRHKVVSGPAVVTLEAHGRENIVEGLDVSRTVGWFTSLYPVRLDLAGLTGDAAVAAVRRALEAVPNRGAGFGMLAELTPAPELQRLPGGIGFNYLGRIAAPAGSDLFEPGLASLGDPVDPGSLAPFAIDLLASIEDDTLNLILSHGTAVLDAAVGEQVIGTIVDELCRLPAAGSAMPPAVRPYIGRVADDVPLRLHPDRPHAVFAMPPLFGYGAAFRNVGEQLTNVAFHAFDFIEGDDRITRYVRAIRAHAGGRPLTMLGYSGGGNLAFAVAKGLEDAGTQVARVILLDAPMKLHAIEQDDAAIQAMMDNNLGYFRDRLANDADYGAYMLQPDLRALMLRKMEAFIRYLNGLIDDGRIDADIHLLRSAQDWATPAEWNGWADHTNGRFAIHQGTGDHSHMTEGESLDRNTRIILRILAGDSADDGTPRGPVSPAGLIQT
ncbi:non-ribosomal peptide synthetase [Acidisphaera sp. S103]|uniref:non-ribosomal peptide synthetase n=1 Tax=Acidisphaera sp. S103 TaxID=1747223 RepID=UPI00131D2A24|nr:non-ribosomal peptide synthetase [Acidisphaera sp. S103]